MSLATFSSLPPNLIIDQGALSFRKLFAREAKSRIVSAACLKSIACIDSITLVIVEHNVSCAKSAQRCFSMEKEQSSEQAILTEVDI